MAEQLVKDNWQNINGVLYYQGLSYVPEIIWTKLITKHHKNLQGDQFVIKKICELIAQKYYQPLFHHDVKDFEKGCNGYLASKAVYHRLYSNLQSLPVSIQHWRDLSIDFVSGLFITTDWKEDSYDSIFVIVDWLTKMVYYKLVKITINVLGLAKIIINVVMKHHGLLDSIVTNRISLFISKFWSLLYYFFSIKQRLSTIFLS